MIRTSIILLIFSISSLAQAESEIYKCVDEDGNLAFQDSPCPAPAEPAAAEPAAEPAVEPATATETAPAAVPVEEFEPADGVSYVPVASNRPARDVEACKGPHRDGIDAIEAEMLRGYSTEQGESYKQELRALTDALRACE